ncbi:TonB-linked outer membrane protein, SusC/RagA family [Catalinimonas alkaloidigena]|uniref:TonB-linked outer membrane protein, SusC/RagA family n=1 Tax=Catalinimonas alkaloidigena TaxID=1075417 RepID=A0A1G9QGC5_9BACT|nr:TonB-dependent receptor [Catalinimonas alkaloidigena]SDM09537.1 TonB-linked outer membrane protein, SusC/RagA family [Catalinimonas alkaloidigena]
MNRLNRWPVYAIGWVVLFCLNFALQAQQPALAHVTTPTRIKPDQQPDVKQNRQLSEVLDAVAKKFKITFFYRSDLVEDKQSALPDLNDVQIEHVLENLLTPLELRFQKLEDDTYVILPKTALLPAIQPQGQPQQPTRNTVELLDKKEATVAPRLELTVAGKVTQPDGEGIPGVNILVKGTALGTITDVEGHYSINVPNTSDTLIFSSIGYTAQTVPVAGRTTIDVVLNEDIQNLEEVVVVGYGAKKRSEVLGSVASVDAAEINDLPVGNLGAALYGKVPGLNLATRSSRPGQATKITIREQGTYGTTGTAPLYVINGVIATEADFNALDASEVESISLLKDASAAVYGARAANGVVLVETKRGKVGKPQISVKSTYGLSTPTRTPERLDGYHLAMMLNDRYDIAGVTPDKDPTQLRYTEDELEYFRTHPGSDWLAAAWQNPMTNRNTLNISGGSDNVRYFVGGAYYNETGAFDNLTYRKYNIRASVTADITRDLTATVNLSGDINQDQRPNVDGEDGGVMSISYKGLLLTPDWYPTYINGLPSADAPVTERNRTWHPLEVFKESSGFIKNKNNGMNVNLSADYRVPFVKGLKVSMRYNRNNRDTWSKQYRVPYTLYQFNRYGENNHLIGDQVVQEVQAQEGNQLLEIYDNNVSYQFNTSLAYDRAFGKHSINALLIYEQAENEYNTFRARRENFLIKGVPYLRAAPKDDNTDAYGNASEGGRLSYIGRLNYSFANKYLFEGTFRRDGSQIFAPESRFGFFPSVSVGWRISEENFFRPLTFVNQLKLRASAGLLGNDGVGAWQWRERYDLGSGSAAYFGDAFVLGLQKSKDAVNRSITWEKTEMYNVGFDANLFQNRFNLSMDAYFKHTYDILTNLESSTPTTAGVQRLPEINYGVMNAKGIEMALGYNGRIGEEFRYSVSGNFALSTNRVIVKAENPGAPEYQRMVGKRTNREQGYYATGIIRTQEELDALLAANPNYTIFGLTPALGMMNYRDIRGANYSEGPDGKIDENDEDNIYVGQGVPMGLGISLSWRNFSFNTTFNGQLGGREFVDKPARRGIMDFDKERSDGLGLTTYSFWADHWTPSNPDAEYPRAFDSGADVNSTFWMRSGTQIRMRNMSLSYNLPKSISSSSKYIPDIRVLLTGTNLFILYDDVKYKDPAQSMGFDYPLMRNISLGIDITL